VLLAIAMLYSYRFIHLNLCYSDRKLFTGFASDARIAW
jgi:hypothetical protein